MTTRRYETNSIEVRDEIIATYQEKINTGIIYLGDPAKHNGNHVIVTDCPKDTPVVYLTYGGRKVKLGGGTPREADHEIMVRQTYVVREGRVGYPASMK